MVGSMFVIEGIDGSGKSTLAVSLDGKSGLQYISPKTIASGHPLPQRSMATLSDLIWPPAEWKAFAHIQSSRYWMHLQASWYELFGAHVCKPALESGSNLVLDGLCYKFMAKLMLAGHTLEFLEEIFPICVIPEQVVLLKVDPAEIWERQRSFSPYEMGSMYQTGAIGRHEFIDFQSAIQGNLDEMAKRWNWSLVDVGKGETPALTSQRIQQIVVPAAV